MTVIIWRALKRLLQAGEGRGADEPDGKDITDECTVLVGDTR
jgi:hypothetical protein